MANLFVELNVKKINKILYDIETLKFKNTSFGGLDLDGITLIIRSLVNEVNKLEAENVKLKGGTHGKSSS
jgi:hypothetical protein